MRDDSNIEATDEKTISRRSMLMKLGLAAGAIYAAPVVLQLGEAKASSFSRPSGPRRHNAGANTRRSPRSFTRPGRPRQNPRRSPRSFSR